MLIDRIFVLHKMYHVKLSYYGGSSRHVRLQAIRVKRKEKYLLPERLEPIKEKKDIPWDIVF